MNIILLGPPGSGKGTQARLLADTLGLYYLEAGKLSRKWAKKDPKIKKIVESGGLIPEKKMSAYVYKHLESKHPEADNILFEGYPRFVSQYEDLENWLQKRGGKIDKVLYLNVGEDEIIKRLSVRRMDKKTGKIYNLKTEPPPASVDPKDLTLRADDKPKAIKERLEEFGKNTFPIVSYAQKQGKLVEVNGEDSVETVFESIMKGIGK
jgi:adenylate kinase